MSEIAYASLKSYLLDRSKTAFDPVCLVYGEEFLYEQAAREIVCAILPDPAARRHQYEVVHPKEQADMVDIIDRMNTYSFFSEKKIIELKDATIFVSRQNQENLLEKIRARLDDGAPEKAAPLFLSLLGRLGLGLSDLTDTVIQARFSGEEGASGDVAWMRQLADFCRESHQTVPVAGNDAERLKAAILKGFPKGHYLIISTDTVDKRKALYKTIQECGVIIDCSVPKGPRKADQDEQRRVLRQHAEKLLGKCHKKILPQALEEMFQRIGFDLRTFTTSLEKLMDYARDRDAISITDVQAVLSRTRQDPVYELTGAVSERNTVASLHFVGSLLSSGYHYLQVLTALTNQVRKLLLIRGFMETTGSGAWQSGMGFDRFKQQVLPLILKHDEATVRKAHENRMAGKGEAGKKAKTGDGDKTATDLIIAKNPNNPYPVYQQFLGADKFSTRELGAAVLLLHGADVRLKTTGQSPARILEEVVLKICEKP